MRRITIRRVRRPGGPSVCSFEMAEIGRVGGLAGVALAVAGSLLFVGGADAAIYRCTDKGRTSFRDRPCAPSERQVRLDQGPLAGCHEIEDVTEWPGGSGTWVVRIAADGDGYQLREHFSAQDPDSRQAEPENVPLRRATLEEIDAVAQQFRLKVASGYVVDGVENPSTTGLFNTWNATGELQVVGLFSFANGQAKRVTCP